MKSRRKAPVPVLQGTDNHFPRV